MCTARTADACNDPRCDEVIALTDSEAAVMEAAGHKVEGQPGRRYLVIESYAHLAHFSIRG